MKLMCRAEDPARSASSSWLTRRCSRQARSSGPTPPAAEAASGVALLMPPTVTENRAPRASAPAAATGIRTRRPSTRTPVTARRPITRTRPAARRPGAADGMLWHAE
ncbi:hypothetical protein GCM10009535_33970 [Streptomyces thermocarboxydovorans]|uniref:Uncharacterized protein n=1 Tax=Streptomyces thermocarboxydovorans TaxID=59298 RepID=A0ABP3SML3_9ACTN